MQIFCNVYRGAFVSFVSREQNGEPVIIDCMDQVTDAHFSSNGGYVDNNPASDYMPTNSTQLARFYDFSSDAGMTFTIPRTNDFFGNQLTIRFNLGFYGLPANVVQYLFNFTGQDPSMPGPVMGGWTLAVDNTTGAQKTLVFSIAGGASFYIDGTTGTSFALLTDGNMHDVCVEYDQTIGRCQIWIDRVSQTVVTMGTGTTIMPAMGMTAYLISGVSSPGGGVQVDLDNLQFWSKLLSFADIVYFGTIKADPFPMLTLNASLKTKEVFAEACGRRWRKYK